MVAKQTMFELGVAWPSPGIDSVNVWPITVLETEPGAVVIMTVIAHSSSSSRSDRCLQSCSSSRPSNTHNGYNCSRIYKSRPIFRVRRAVAVRLSQLYVPPPVYVVVMPDDGQPAVVVLGPTVALVL